MKRIFPGNGSARRSGAIIAMCVAGLAGIGLLTILGVTMTPAMESSKATPWDFAYRQVGWILGATVACVALARIDYHTILRRSWILLVLVWVALVAALAFSPSVRNTHRWLMIGGMGIQVSEFAKLVILLCCVRYVSMRKNCLGSYVHGFLPIIPWLGLTVLLIALAPDFGGSMFLCGTALTFLSVAGVRLRHIIPTALLLLVPFMAFMMWKFGHIMERLNKFSSGESWQVDQSLVALGSGGLFGRGLGAGRAHLWFIPDVHNDFIFAAIGEQMGMLGTLSVLLLFLVLLWHGLKIAFCAPDNEGFLVVFGLVFMIVFQAGVNACVVTGLVPPKGISLPFVSYGGSSFLMLGCALGVILNVSMQAVERSAGSFDEFEGKEEVGKSGVEASPAHLV